MRNRNGYFPTLALDRGSKIGGGFAHLGTFRDFLVVTGDGGVSDNSWEEAKDTGNHPTMHKKDPTTKIYLTQNVSNGTAEVTSKLG